MLDSGPLQGDVVRFVGNLDLVYACEADLDEQNLDYAQLFAEYSKRAALEFVAVTFVTKTASDVAGVAVVVEAAIDVAVPNGVLADPSDEVPAVAAFGYSSLRASVAGPLK